MNSPRSYSTLTILAIFLTLNNLTVHGQCLINSTYGLAFNFSTQFTNAGRGVAVYDMNRDGLDDIVFPTAYEAIVMYLNNGNSFTPIDIIPNDQDIKQVLCFDFDNDGDSDILLTAYMGTNKFFRNDGEWIFTDITSEAGIIDTGIAASFGAAAGDYNNDGWLDVYISFYMHEDYTNMLYRNNGDGTFTEVAQALGVDNGMHATMMSVFFDYNNDGFQDIYVMNDLGDGDALFSNNGDGTFTDITIPAGITEYSNSMSIGIADFDNDSDQDIYVSSTESYGNLLYRNNGDSTFHEIADSLGIAAFSDSWSSMWFDVNNDRYTDLYVANDLNTSTSSGPANKDDFYLNSANGFIESPIVFPEEGYGTYGVAKGDFNNDGLPDLVLTNGFDENAVIYQSTCGGFGSVKITLEGTSSNRDGIGSRIESWAGGSPYYQYFMAGESYLDQNSQHIIIPLAQSSVLDTLKIYWLSGWVDTFYDIQMGSNLYIHEGSSLITAHLNNVETTEFCAGESAVLSVEGDWTEYHWSNGYTNPELVVTESGDYFAVVKNENNLIFHTDTIHISVLPTPQYDLEIHAPDCFDGNDGSLLLHIDSLSAEATVIWNDESTDTARFNLPAGIYSFEISLANGCSVQENILLPNPDPILADAIPTSLFCFEDSSGSIQVQNIFGGEGILTCQIFSGNFENSQSGNQDQFLFTNLLAGEYEILITDTNQCTWSEMATITQPDSLELLASSSGVINAPIYAVADGGNPPYSYSWCDGTDDEFIVLQDSTNCNFMVTDQNNCTAEATIIFLTSVMEVSHSDISYFISENILSIYSPKEIFQVEMFDLSGNKCKAGIARGGKNSQINLSGFSSGVYLIRLIDIRNEIHSFKIVI